MLVKRVEFNQRKEKTQLSEDQSNRISKLEQADLFLLMLFTELKSNKKHKQLLWWSHKIYHCKKLYLQDNAQITNSNKAKHSLYVNLSLSLFNKDKPMKKLKLMLNKKELFNNH
jgi:hypothetical protein